MPPLLLYDGVCGLCNRLVQFVLQRDPAGVFRFAALQSALAASILARHGADPQDLDTVYVVVNYELPDERLLARSDAVIFILTHLGARAPGPTPSKLKPAEPATSLAPGRGFWPFVAGLLRLVPRPLRNWGYSLVARLRYRIFGRYDTCPIPSADTRSRFLDQ